MADSQVISLIVEHHEHDPGPPVEGETGLPHVLLGGHGDEGTDGGQGIAHLAVGVRRFCVIERHPDHHTSCQVHPTKLKFKSW